MNSAYDVVVIGAGAAGIGAGRRLAEAGKSFLLVEARDRIGGRAHTIAREHPIDLGCGWLHSADRNVLAAMAEREGFSVDHSPPPWRKKSEKSELSLEEQADMGQTFMRFEQRIENEAESAPSLSASAYLEPGSRWTPMMNAIFSYISGAALDEIDARDYARYGDTDVNWRVREGYGALIAALGAGLPVSLSTQVEAIEQTADRVRVRTTRGEIEARAVIVSVPTSRLAAISFTPALPEKIEAAAVLPLGAAEKLYFALEGAEEFEIDSRIFTRADTAETGAYHVRPAGKPMIEGYFGGALARRLALAGGDAMESFAREELTRSLGAGFNARLRLIAHSAWAADPHAQGSYSYAKPGFADARAVLAAPAGLVLFAGEACSKHNYSTAHGAFETGLLAAEQALALLA